MNRQQAYEYVRTYLTRPGARRAMDPEREVCCYETRLEGETHRCAVGCLLTPNDLASGMADFEGGVRNLFDKFGIPHYLEDVGVSFLSALQAMHDDCCEWEDGKFYVQSLDEIAAQWGLTVVVDEKPPIPEPAMVIV